MTELPEVKTVATAREMSLIKWNRVKAFYRDLFNEIDKSCGFCELGSYRSRARCTSCVVLKRCRKIQREARKLEEKMTELIDETITFLQDMDVKEK